MNYSRRTHLFTVAHKFMTCSQFLSPGVVIDLLPYFQVLLFFNSKDRDRDGRISYEEFCDRETVNERAFKAMDLNRDGFITKAEMLKASNRGSRR